MLASASLLMCGCACTAGRYCVAVLVTSLKPSPLAIFLVTAQMGDNVGAAIDYYDLPVTHHALGWAGGVAWAVGTLSNLVAGNSIGLGALTCPASIYMALTSCSGML